MKRAVLKKLSRTAVKIRKLSKQSKLIKAVKIKKRKPLAKFNPTPRSASEIKLALATSSSAGSSVPVTYKVGFWGAGAIEPPGEHAAGNTWFGEIMEAAKVPKKHRYNHAVVMQAVWDLFKFLDVNNDFIITQSEIDGLVLTACGFSKGGPAALEFTQHISQPGLITVKPALGHNPAVVYNLQAPIPVEMLLTIDPVPIGDEPLGNIPSTVSNFANRYQRKGGKSTFRLIDGTFYKYWGATLSELFKGVPLTAASTSTNMDQQPMPINEMPLSIQVGFPFLNTTPELLLRNNELSHGSMPWFVMPWAIASLT